MHKWLAALIAFTAVTAGATAATYHDMKPRPGHAVVATYHDMKHRP
jgi:hypothetical protein